MMGAYFPCAGAITSFFLTLAHVPPLALLHISPSSISIHLSISFSQSPECLLHPKHMCQASSFLKNGISLPYISFSLQMSSSLPARCEFYSPLKYSFRSVLIISGSWCSECSSVCAIQLKSRQKHCWSCQIPSMNVGLACEEGTARQNISKPIVFCYHFHIYTFYYCVSHNS